MDRPRRSDCTAGQMDGDAGWWTQAGRSDSPHQQGSWEWIDNNNKDMLFDNGRLKYCTYIYMTNFLSVHHILLLKNITLIIEFRLHFLSYILGMYFHVQEITPFVVGCYRFNSKDELVRCNNPIISMILNTRDIKIT